MTATPRRLVFGEVADLYDRHRPGYPPDLIADVVREAGLGPGDRVLEVGAGTGKATAALLAHGLTVVAVEPSRDMADRLRRRGGAGQLEIILSDFERADLGEATFGLLVSAQAWHWVDPVAGFRRARAALRVGGEIALIWNRIAWAPDDPVRRALADTYARVVPEMSADGALHPANPDPLADPDWSLEINSQPGFDDAAVRLYPWSVDYTAQTYPALLATLSEIRLLEAVDRERLLAAVRDTLEAHGGRFTMPLTTRLCTARAV